MKNLKGFTLLELVVVIGIMGIMIGATIFRISAPSNANQLEQAANIFQTAVIEARDKARSPKPSGTIDEETDVFGYGIKFDTTNNKQFILFKDVYDPEHPEFQNYWKDPDDTDIDDEELKTYFFSDSKIENVILSGYSVTLTTGPTINLCCDHSLTFSSTENSFSDKISCGDSTDGVYSDNNIIDYFSFVLLYEGTGDTKEIRVDYDSLEVSII